MCDNFRTISTIFERADIPWPLCSVFMRYQSWAQIMEKNPKMTLKKNNKQLGELEQFCLNHRATKFPYSCEF